MKAVISSSSSLCHIHLMINLCILVLQVQHLSQRSHAFTIQSSTPSNNPILLERQHHYYHHHHQLKQTQNQQRSSRTILLYGQNRKYNSSSNNKKVQLPSIPVIGPIISSPPLMIGAEMTLDPPTPLQWKALQECVVEHHNRFANNNDDNDDNGLKSKTATIQAAPLIAIIDEASGSSKINVPNSIFREGGRYATLAAIVGITKKKQTSYGKDGNVYNHNDEEDFMDYMESCSIDDDVDSIQPFSSTVRLVGVGRAILRKFYYKVPSELCNEDFDSSDKEKEESKLKEYDARVLEYYKDDNEEIDDDDEITFNGGYEDSTPIVMSEFEPLNDDCSIYTFADPNLVGEKGQRSYRSSPVHAISELFNLAHKVAFVHDDRRKLIAGIKAAKARLEINQARKNGKIQQDNDDDLIDHDGLGALFENCIAETIDEGKNAEEENGMTVDEFLSTFKGNMQRIDPSDLPQNQLSKVALLESRENFGMSYYGSFSSIAEMTKATLSLLEPYYSPQYRAREENEAEVSSFVVYRALEGYIDKKEIVYALHCTSSIERLMRAYELMVDHKIQLKKIAEKMSDELRQCGEECTDLF